MAPRTQRPAQDLPPTLAFPRTLGFLMHALSEFRGSPVVLVFQSRDWDPAEDELVELYNGLIAGLPLPASAGVRLVRVSRSGSHRSLTFDDGALALPLVDGDDRLAAELGVSDETAVVVLDANGEIRWRHDGASQPGTADLARAVTDAALPARGAGSDLSRRQFVATVLGVACAIAIAPAFAAAERRPGAPTDAEGAPGDARPVTLDVNGKTLTLQLEPRVTLLDALREYAGLTGSKKGCDHGQCGACTVHIDGRRQLSCLTLAMMAQGKRVTTIEGLARGDDLHPMQQAFITHDGFQCGYCTPGQIMSATAMLDEPWGPADADVREAMSGNICRCGAYLGIVAAIQDVRSARRATQ